MEAPNTPRPIMPKGVRTVRLSDPTSVVKALQRLAVEPGDVVLVRAESCLDIHEVQRLGQQIADYLGATGLTDALVLLVPDAPGVSLDVLDAAAMAAAGWIRGTVASGQDDLERACRRLRDTRAHIADDHRAGRPYDRQPLVDATQALCALVDQRWPQD